MSLARAMASSTNSPFTHHASLNTAWIQGLQNDLPLLQQAVVRMRSSRISRPAGGYPRGSWASRRVRITGRISVERLKKEMLRQDAESAGSAPQSNDPSRMNRTNSISFLVKLGGPFASSICDRRCSLTADAVNSRRKCLTPFISPSQCLWCVASAVEVMSGAMTLESRVPQTTHPGAGHAGAARREATRNEAQATGLQGDPDAEEGARSYSEIQEHAGLDEAQLFWITWCSE